MTLNQNAFSAHVEFNIETSTSITRDATFLESVCFHLVEDGTSITSAVSTVATQSSMNVEFSSFEPSDATWEKIDGILAFFFSGGGKRALFLVTSPALALEITDVSLIESQALSIASGEDISSFESIFRESVLLFPTSNKSFVNTLKQSYVFYVADASLGLNGDFLAFLTMLFSKTGDAFFDRKIMFSGATMITPSNALVYKEDILQLHSQKLSSYELIDSPTTGRVSNFATSIDNGMGIYQRYRVKLACEQALDELIQKYNFKYNALTMEEGVGGMIGGVPNCLVWIYSVLQGVMTLFVSRGVITPNYIIYIPEQSKEDQDRGYITGIQSSFNPYKNPFRIEGTFRDSIASDSIVSDTSVLAFSRGAVLGKRTVIG